MLSVEFNTAPLEEVFREAAYSAENFETVLYKFGGYLIKKARLRYGAQNFTPLAQSTLKHRATAGVKQLEKKLARDVIRAIKRQTAANAPKGRIAKVLTALALKVAPISAPSRGVQNRAAVLSAYRRRHKMGDSSLMAVAQGKQLTLKQEVSLRDRTARAVAKAVDRPILGQLNRSPVFEVGNDSVTLRSQTAKKWSEVQNDGGTAGHGANIPARPTIFVDSEDLRVLREMLIEHCVAPLDGED